MSMSLSLSVGKHLPNSSLTLRQKHHKRDASEKPNRLPQSASGSTILTAFTKYKKKSAAARKPPRSAYHFMSRGKTMLPRVSVRKRNRFRHIPEAVKNRFEFPLSCASNAPKAIPLLEPRTTGEQTVPLLRSCASQPSMN